MIHSHEAEVRNDAARHSACSRLLTKTTN